MRLWWIVVAAAACCPTPRPAADAAPAPDLGGLEGIAWLAGTWVSLEDGQRTEEHWSEPRGGTMMAHNRTVADGRTVHHEFLMLVVGEGGLVLRAMPKGQPAAEFPAVEQTPSKVVFEDPAHDYPQRIIYARQPDGSLLTRIEGLREGKPDSSEWRWQRR